MKKLPFFLSFWFVRLQARISTRRAKVAPNAVAGTNRVDLLLERLQLRLDLLQEHLHALVAADGTARRP